ncbi:MAG: class I SAM-dependent methyltransferase [Solirubrobacterales bacterium]
MSEITDSHSTSIRDEFAHQADAFARSPTMSADAEGAANVSFEVGDATALDLPDDFFDGAITRFSLHHIPAPIRVLEEMRRVVRPGGWVVVPDFVTDDDGEAKAWQEGIERLRDPSHWALLTPSRIEAQAARARSGRSATATRCTAGACRSGRSRQGQSSRSARTVKALDQSSGVVEVGMPVWTPTRSGRAPAGVVARRRSRTSESAARRGGPSPSRTAGRFVRGSLTPLLRASAASAASAQALQAVGAVQGSDPPSQPSPGVMPYFVPSPMSCKSVRSAAG